MNFNVGIFELFQEDSYTSQLLRNIYKEYVIECRVALGFLVEKRSVFVTFPKLPSSKCLPLVFRNMLICKSAFLTKFSPSFRVTPSSENPNGATSSVSQGKPSLRRIKGRLHRSKSLDSFDFCELTVSGLVNTFFTF